MNLTAVDFAEKRSAPLSQLAAVLLVSTPAILIKRHTFGRPKP